MGRAGTPYRAGWYSPSRWASCGDLAHTGSDIPIGLITGAAAALAAAGVALVWWMRRRKTDAE
ncbi:LPXTG cell wall anchor domain-containing protein [Streptomyces caniferus]|uniref:LPXTG cell wall anchor domain-containing protein n=1 Tax=Streptomyces caniferus TaxID=285557 RepID=UPI002E2DB6D3|nr:LPXTG cell wall anchor domain-containing protein [Streptomyces caniferus]